MPQLHPFVSVVHQFHFQLRARFEDNIRPQTYASRRETMRLRVLSSIYDLREHI